MSALEGIESALSRKTGPLPNWGWSLVAVGIVWVIMRRRSGSGANAQAAAAQAAALSGDGSNATVDPYGATFTDPTQLPYPNGPMAGFLSSDPQNSAYPVGLTPQGVPGPVTNVQWSRLVADYLIGLGDAPLLTTTAIAKYIGGGASTLTQSEQAIIDQALTHFGSPPEGLIVTTPTTTPTPVTPPTPTAGSQLRYVLHPGASMRLTDYIKLLLGATATPAQIEAERQTVVNDPRNAGVRNTLSQDKIYGGGAVWFPAGGVQAPGFSAPVK